MTNAIRKQLMASGKLKPAQHAEGVHADPRAIKSRAHEALAHKTAAALAILNAAVRRAKESA